jgi:hypothetical protein
MKDEIFSQLREWSKKKDSYSIRDFANNFGTSYKTILALSKEDEVCEYELNMARDRLGYNAHKAIHSKKINFEKWLRYAYENDYELREQLQEEGEIIPEDEDEFDIWVEKQIAEDKIKYGS